MKVLTVYAHPNPKSFCHAVLEQFTAGLKDAGHISEVVDLYAIRFDPVFRTRDLACFIYEDMPMDVLESMDVKRLAIDSAGGPIQQAIAARVLRDMDLPSVVRLIRSQRPRDIVAQQEKIAQADGLAFIAPIYWLSFPAIMKGWFERVFSSGFAFNLSSAGWRGDLAGRMPLLHHQKALVINTTLFREESYKAGLEEPIAKVIDDWGLRYPGIKNVEHVYFYAVSGVDDDTRRGYLQRAYRLGKEFAHPEYNPACNL